MSGRIQLIPNGRTYETAIYSFILLWVWGEKKIKAPQEDKISYVSRIRLGDLAR